MWETWREQSDWRVFHISMAGSYSKAPQGAPGGCGRFVGKSDAFSDFSINVHGREGAGKISFWKVGDLKIQKRSGWAFSDYDIAQNVLLSPTFQERGGKDVGNPAKGGRHQSIPVRIENGDVKGFFHSGFPQAFHALEMKFFLFRFRPEGPTFGQLPKK